MNAGGVDKACKSRGYWGASWSATGERGSNTWVHTPKSGITSRKIG